MEQNDRGKRLVSKPERKDGLLPVSAANSARILCGFVAWCEKKASRRVISTPLGEPHPHLSFIHYPRNDAGKGGIDVALLRRYIHGIGIEFHPQLLTCLAGPWVDHG